MSDQTNEYGYTRAEVADEYEPSDPKAFNVADAEEKIEVCS